MRPNQGFPRLEREATLEPQLDGSPSMVHIVAIYFRAVLLNLLEAIRRWRRDDAGLLSACVAYYATISLFPMLMVLIAGLGIFLRFTSTGQSSEQFVLTVIAQETTFEIAEQVNIVFHQVQQQAMFSGPLAMVGLVAAAMAVFTQFDRAFDKIWKVEPPVFDGFLTAARRGIMQRLRAFLTLFSLGAVVALIFFVSLALNAIACFSNEQFDLFDQAWANRIWRIVQVAVCISLNAIIFTAIYKWLPKVPVGWLHAARGGLLTAATWEVGRFLLATYFSVANYNAYGVAGALLAAMLWVYYASGMVFLGAEYVQVIREREQQIRNDAALQRKIEKHILRTERSVPNVQVRRANVDVRRAA
jgi:membrane protein